MKESSRLTAYSFKRQLKDVLIPLFYANHLFTRVSSRLILLLCMSKYLHLLTPTVTFTIKLIFS